MEITAGYYVTSEFLSGMAGFNSDNNWNKPNLQQLWHVFVSYLILSFIWQASPSRPPSLSFGASPGPTSSCLQPPA